MIGLVALTFVGGAEPCTAEVAAGTPPRSAPAVAPASVPQASSPAELPATLGPLDRAALAMLEGDARTALAALEGTSTGPAADAQLRATVLRGRALRALGRAKEAVEVLAPLFSGQRGFSWSERMPPESPGLELVLARLQAAEGLAPAEAKLTRQEAAKLAGRLLDLKVNRVRAPLRVLEAKALALSVIHDQASRARALAARRAHDLLGRAILDFPLAPMVGELKLLKAQTLIAQDKPGDAAHELRALVITRAGEPESEVAQAEIDRLRAAHPKKVKVKGFTVGEQLERASAARSLRRVELSRRILDEILADPKTSTGIRAQALRARSATAYRQRDYVTCAADLRGAAKNGNLETRDDMVRCLERAGQYDEILSLLTAQAKGRKGHARKHALWEGIDLAIRGGQYERAEQLLAAYEEGGRGHAERRRWLHAWLAYRLGRDAEAADRFAEVADKSSNDRVRARYFEGKLRLRSEIAEDRTAGTTILRGLIERDPFDYYAIQARARLTEAGEPAPAARLSPMGDEASEAGIPAALVALEDLGRRFGSAWPDLERVRQLLGIADLDGARRELRVAADRFLAADQGGRLRGPHHEEYGIGSTWKGTWEAPKLPVSREGRKLLRDPESAEALRRGLRELSRLLEEPHRYARLSGERDGNRRARWHPRAFRSAVEQSAATHDLDPAHLWALMYTESRFRRRVVSPVGARGALQIMPWTGRQLAEGLGEIGDGDRFDVDRLFDTDYNVHLAGRYVAELLRKFHGQAPLAYASYNGGPTNVARWLEAKAAGPTPLELDAFVEEIPFVETYNYTRRVIEVAAAYGVLYGDGIPTLPAKLDPVYEDNIDF